MNTRLTMLLVRATFMHIGKIKLLPTNSSEYQSSCKELYKLEEDFYEVKKAAEGTLNSKCE